MRGAWAVAFVAGCACGVVLGRLWSSDAAAPGIPPDEAAAKAAGVSSSSASEISSLASSGEDRRASGRARRDETAAPSGGSVAARILELTPDDRWDHGISDTPAGSLSRDELIAATKAFLVRRLSLERAAGIQLRPFLERFLAECPDVPLDRDDVLAFVAQDQSGLGFDLMRHIPAADRMAAFVTLFEGGPPWDGSGMEQKGDGAGKLFDLVVEDDPERARALLAAAMRGANPRRIDLAHELVQRRPKAFAALLAGVAAHDPDPARRRNAFLALARVRDQDPDVAAAFGPLVLARAQSDDSEERMGTYALLAYADAAGMDLACKLLDRGGLDAEEEAALVSSLVHGGRVADVIAPAMSAARVAALVEAVREIDDDDERAQVLAALGPRVAEISCPVGYQESYAWGELVCELGRGDLALAAARSSARPALVRGGLLSHAIDAEGSAADAIAYASEVLADAASSATLRRAAVDAIVCTSGGHAHDASVELLRRVAASDANAAIRAAAAAGVKSMAEPE